MVVNPEQWRPEPVLMKFKTYNEKYTTWNAWKGIDTLRNNEKIQEDGFAM
jgi:hypothetical protein